MKLSGSLYKLSFSSGKSYIGITKKDIFDRYNGHKKSSESGGRSCIHRAWRKHGPPKVQVLAIVEDNLLAETEQKAIASFETLVPKGYNMTIGGDISPMSNKEVARRANAKRRSHQLIHPFSRPEIAHRLAEKRRGDGNAMRRPEVAAKVSGANHPMNKYPELRARMRGNKNIAKRLEVRMKISESKKGAKNAMKRPEIAAKVSAALKGRTLSLETRAKMSAAQKGKPWSAARAAVSSKPCSEETRAKISASHFGIRPSEETRRKMSETRRRKRHKSGTPS